MSKKPKRFVALKWGRKNRCRSIVECREPKRAVLFEYLSKIQYTKLEITDEVLRVADRIIEMGIILKVTRILIL